MLTSTTSLHRPQGQHSSTARILTFTDHHRCRVPSAARQHSSKPRSHVHTSCTMPRHMPLQPLISSRADSKLLRHRVGTAAAAPPVDTPTRAEVSSPDTSEADGDVIDWRQRWYAVHPVASLPEDRPWAVQILGRELVVWRDGEGEWRVFDDACPHRRVALSEGRKEADGTLACAYHGWRFDGEGKCTEIPQITDEERSARTRAAPAACATSFPTAVRDGLLFLWMVPGSDGLLQSSQVQVPTDKEVEARGGFRTEWYARKMPMSCMVLMENLTDPSHFSFAHHGTDKNTSRYKPGVPVLDKVERHGKSGYRVGETTYRKNSSGYSRSVQDVTNFPGLHHLHVRRPFEEFEGEMPENPGSLDGDRLVSSLCIYITPVSKTECLLVFRGQTYPGKKSSLAAKIFKVLPTWFFHTFTQSSVLDGDMVFLNRQSLQLLSEKIAPEDYWMPAPADGGTREMWRHFNKYSPDGVNYYPHEADTSLLPPEQLLDRYEQHVKDCKYCSEALANIRKLIWLTLPLVLACVTASAYAVASSVLAGAAAKGKVILGVGGVVMGLLILKARQMLQYLEKKFMFEPYVHQEKN